MKNTLFKSSSFDAQKLFSLKYQYKNNALQDLHEYIPTYQTIRLIRNYKTHNI